MISEAHILFTLGVANTDKLHTIDGPLTFLCRPSAQHSALIPARIKSLRESEDANVRLKELNGLLIAQQASNALGVFSKCLLEGRSPEMVYFPAMKEPSDTKSDASQLGSLKQMVEALQAMMARQQEETTAKLASQEKKLSDESSKIRTLEQERDERRADQEKMVKRERKLKGQISSLSRKLAHEIEERRANVEELVRVSRNLGVCAILDSTHHVIQVTNLLTPLHLRTLLDLSRQKVLRHTAASTGEELRSNRNVHDLVNKLDEDLTEKPYRPSNVAIIFLCGFNNVRRDGNIAAHTAEKSDIREAVLKQSIGHNRTMEEQLFKFVLDGEEVQLRDTSG